MVYDAFHKIGHKVVHKGRLYSRNLSVFTLGDKSNFRIIEVLPLFFYPTLVYTVQYSIIS
jgi:hypothetical protein